MKITAINMSLGLAALPLHFLGMVGIIREQRSLVLSYSVFMAISTIGLTLAAVYAPLYHFYWSMVVISILCSSLAVFFAMDLPDVTLAQPQNVEANGKEQIGGDLVCTEHNVVYAQMNEFYRRYCDMFNSYYQDLLLKEKRLFEPKSRPNNFILK